MKHREINQGRKSIISLLIAVTMVVTTILPSAAVYASDESYPDEYYPDGYYNAADEENYDGYSDDWGYEDSGEYNYGNDYGYDYSETDPYEGYDYGEVPNGYEADVPGGDILPKNTDGDVNPAEPENAVSTGTTLTVEEDQLIVTLSGDYSGEALSLCVPENAETQKAALEEIMGAPAELFRIVELRNEYNEPVILGVEETAYENEISVTVGGTWLFDYAEPVFALIDAEGNVQIVEAQRETLEDGTSVWHSTVTKMERIPMAVINSRSKTSP